MIEVLIVSKTTNLELHGRAVMRRVASGHLTPQHFDFLKKAHDDHYATLRLLYDVLKRNQISYHEIGRGHYWPEVKQIPVVITVGGDGTVLEASHHMMGLENQLLLGIRSSNTSVGHLCCADIHTLQKTIQDLAHSHLPWIEVARLKALVHVAETGGIIKTDPVLNDFLYANTSPAAMTRYRLYIGDEHEEHKSSGIWVATPAGSTAAIAAAGGQDVAISNLTDFQFWVREPYTPPHRPNLKLSHGLFNPSGKSVVIENLSEQALLALDGQHGQIALHFGDRVEFKKADSIRLAVASA